jgi:hypothetical protein
VKNLQKNFADPSMTARKQSKIGAGTSDNMASGAGGCGMKCHEARYESIFMRFEHHMPSLTESAGKVISMKNPTL